LGSKGSQTTQQQATNQTYTPDPAVKSAGYQAISAAQSAAGTPFQQPIAPVAGFSPLQQQVFGQYSNLVNQPYYQTAGNLYNQSAQAVTPNDVNQYLNPYIGSVTANLQDIFGQQNAQNTGNLVQSAGGIGADRIAVGQSELAKQQGLAAGQTYSNIYGSALAAAQADKAREAQAAQGLTGLGGQTLGGANAAGLLQQQQQQAQLNAPYQWQLAQLAYPFQTAQYLAGITGGLSGALGGTTNGWQTSVTTPPQPSLLNQIVGLGTAGVGAYNAFGGTGGINSYLGGYGGENPGSQSNPLPGLSPSDYEAPGLGVYADGGGIEDPGLMSEMHGPGSVVPTVNLQPSAAYSGDAKFQQPQQQQQQQSNSGGGWGDVAKLAANIIPLFLKDGGSAYPHYDDGGDLPYSPDELGESPLVNRLKKNFDEFSTAAPPPPQTYAPPIIRPPLPASAPTGLPVDSGGTSVMSPGDTPFTRRNAGIPFAGADGTVYPVVPPTPAPSGPPARIRGSGSARRAGQSYTAAPEVAEESDRNTPSGMMQSPWMALIQAGAKIASTPGPLGSAIGQGIMAGTKSLETQSGIQDKAKALAQRAKEHLDEYNKMTAAQRASHALKLRELDQNEDGLFTEKARLKLDALAAREHYNQMQIWKNQVANNPNIGTTIPPPDLEKIRADIYRRYGHGAGAAPAGAIPQTSSAPAAGTAPIQVKSPAEAAALAPGTPYVTPDGQHFTR